MLICMSLAIVCDWGTHYGLSPTVRTRAIKFLNHLLTLCPRSPNSWSLSHLFLIFPSVSWEGQHAPFSCALYGFCISIARFSSAMLSFCTSVCSAWYSSTETSGRREEEEIEDISCYYKSKIVMCFLGLKSVTPANSNCNSFWFLVAIYKSSVDPGWCGQLTFLGPFFLIIRSIIIKKLCKSIKMCSHCLGNYSVR